MTGPQPRASRPVSSLLPRWPRSETNAEASTTRPQSAQTISPRISSRVRWDEPHSGHASSAGDDVVGPLRGTSIASAWGGAAMTEGDFGAFAFGEGRDPAARPDGAAGRFLGEPAFMGPLSSSEGPYI